MEMDKFLGEFRPVAPPGELRAKVLAACRPRSPGARVARYVGVAALVLVLLTAVNVSLERRVERLVDGGSLHEGADPPPALENFLRPALVSNRTRRIREESWLRLRVEIEGGR